MASGRSARIRRLSLVQVRTYERLVLELDASPVVLVGPNGVGKTNLLEACAVVLSGASPRTSSELRLIREGAESARISARVQVGDDVHERDVTFQAGRGKSLRVDGNVVRGVEAYGEGSPVSTFLPERLLVIRGAPARRRALVDSITARVVPSAATTLRDYTAALQQRNTLLRRARGGASVDAQLAPWTEQAIALGAAVREHRTLLLDRVAEPFAARFAQLTGLDGAQFTQELRGSGDLVADSEEVAAHERRRGSSLFGPHLDDLLPRIEERDLRAFGSAGEQRAALLAFTFATRDVLTEHTGVEPVLLLDEPWSELDADRRRRLTSMVAQLGQCIITSTEPPSHLLDAAPSAVVLAVSSGQVDPWHAPAPTTE
ncbi:MAG: recF [Thermoleophilia bacterium]|nr:recF [Thermoleophilia bacterium]